MQKELPPSYSIYISTRATIGTVILPLKSWPCRCQCSHRPENFILDPFRIWHVLIPAKAALAGGGVCYLHRTCVRIGIQWIARHMKAFYPNIENNASSSALLVVTLAVQGTMVIARYCGNKTSRNNTNEPAGSWEKHKHTVSCKHTWFVCTQEMGLWREDQFIWTQQAPSTTSTHPPCQSELANSLSDLKKSSDDNFQNHCSPTVQGK